MIEFDFVKPYLRRSLMADYHYWSSPKVFSNRIKKAIESMNVPDVGFIDAEITDRKSNTHDGYSIMHVRRLIVCFTIPSEEVCLLVELSSGILVVVIMEQIHIGKFHPEYGTFRIFW